MGEHHDLHPVVGHVVSEVPITIHHALSEIVTDAGHSQIPPACRMSARKDGFETARIPGQKELREFMIVYRVGVGRVGDPNVRLVFENAAVTDSSIRFSSNRSGCDFVKPRIVHS